MGRPATPKMYECYPPLKQENPWESEKPLLQFFILTIPRDIGSLTNYICRRERLLEGMPVPQHSLCDIAVGTSK